VEELTTNLVNVVKKEKTPPEKIKNQLQSGLASWQKIR